MVVTNPNTMAQVPIDMLWQPGETPRQWQQRQLANRHKPAPAQSPEPIAKEEPKPAPADAYRQQAQQIIREFGEVRGRDYVDRGMTYGEALQAELAAQNAELKQLSEAVAKQDRKAGRGAGFAGKLRFGGSFRAIGGKHEQRKA